LQPWDDLALTTRYSDYDSLVSELQFKSNSDNRLQWIGGLSYIKEDNTMDYVLRQRLRNLTLLQLRDLI